MDCIYLTNEQIESLYKLARKSGRTTFGNPSIGVQIRGTADADGAVEIDAVCPGFSGVAGANIEADGTTGGWTA